MILNILIFIFLSCNTIKPHDSIGINILNSTTCEYNLEIYDLYINKEYTTIVPQKDEIHITFNCGHSRHYMIFETVDSCIPDCSDSSLYDVDETNVLRLEGISGDIYQRLLISNNKFSLIEPKCIKT